MLKSKAIELLGGSNHSAAAKLNVTYQAIEKWPEVLTPRIVDRLIAYHVRNRKRVPAELLSAAYEAKVA